jgi:hypothetical protein
MPHGLLARHPELNHQSTVVDRSGAWQRWQAQDTRLSPFMTLQTLAREWEASRAVACYPAIAALACLGSRRGHHDDAAAIAVLVVLHRDLDCMGEQLRRVCEPDDLMWSLWEAVKRAEPQLGARAPYFLLHRAKESLLSTHRRAACEVACANPLDASRHSSSITGFEPAPCSSDFGESAETELLGLLRWAQHRGVIAAGDAQLLHQLGQSLDREVAVEASLTQAGRRLGVCMRTVRRRRDATIRRLRDAVPEYLAAVS